MNRAALNHLLAMLGLGQKQSAYPRGRLGKLLRRYAEHLANTRGLEPETVRRHLKYTRDMLRRFGTRRESQFRNWTPELIEEDVAREGRSGPGRGRNVGWCARSFLRFLQQSGLIERDLAAAVPTVARWRLASLPTTLSEAEIDRLLSAADLTTALGRRNYAVVLCLSELGLRGADVANLQIDDIDFTAGTLRLKQRKERQADVFPLTPRLRSALQAYLQGIRPACTSSAVFVRHHAPLGKPLTSVGICYVILRLADKAGLRHRVHGPHVLRRSLASRMVPAVLADRIRETGLKDLSLAWSLFDQLVDGLAEMHSSFGPHGDLRAENVVLDSSELSPQSRVTIVNADLAGLPQWTRGERLCPESREIFPPEWNRKLGAGDKSADVFALGLLWIELVGGVRQRHEIANSIRDGRQIHRASFNRKCRGWRRRWLIMPLLSSTHRLSDGSAVRKRLRFLRKVENSATLLAVVLLLGCLYQTAPARPLLFRK